jgi:hypothetical protein
MHMAHQDLVASSQARNADPTIRNIVTAGLAKASARNVAGTNEKPSDIRLLTPISSFVALALALAKANKPAENFKPSETGASRRGADYSGGAVPLIHILTDFVSLCFLAVLGSLM